MRLSFLPKSGRQTSSISILRRPGISTWSIPGACSTTPAPWARPSAARVAPGGLFAFALYRRTRLCGVWRREKRWYAAARPSAQAMARRIYVALLRAKFVVTGGDFRTYVANYKSARGMDFLHDVHDWMGGYPYESITPAEVDGRMRTLGFEHVRSFTQTASLGLFGSGCDEYVYRRSR